MLKRMSWDYRLRVKDEGRVKSEGRRRRWRMKEKAKGECRWRLISNLPFSTWNLDFVELQEYGLWKNQCWVCPSPFSLSLFTLHPLPFTLFTFTFTHLYSKLIKFQVSHPLHLRHRQIRNNARGRLRPHWPLWWRPLGHRHGFRCAFGGSS